MSLFLSYPTAFYKCGIHEVLPSVRQNATDYLTRSKRGKVGNSLKKAE